MMMAATIAMSATSTRIRVRFVMFLYTRSIAQDPKARREPLAELRLGPSRSYRSNLRLGEKAAVVGERLLDPHAGHPSEHVKCVDRRRQHQVSSGCWKSTFEKRRLVSDFSTLMAGRTPKDPSGNGMRNGFVSRISTLNTS